MQATELLIALRERNIRVWLEDDQIRCRSPRGALTDDLRRHLSELKDDLVELLRNAQSELKEELPLRPRDRSGDLPLSFAQERLWFINQIQPSSSAYTITALTLFRGELDSAVLRLSLLKLAERQDALRTTFHARRGSPVARIGSPQVDFEQVDFGEADGDALRKKVSTFANNFARRPFALDKGPLFRAALGALGPEEHVLFISLPHIICDGWSIEILFAEVRKIYADLSTGKPESIESLEINYTDYSGWQREKLSGESLNELLAYWTKQLEGANTVLELPTDRKRVLLDNSSGGVKTFKIPRNVSDDVRRVSAALHTTPFVLMLSAFGILLSRYTGSRDILIGSPIADRRSPVLERVVGLFVNTMVLRVKYSPDDTMRAFLQRMHETVLDAHAHQDLPFEKLVAVLSPERSLAHAPVIQATFAFQNTPHAADVTTLNSGSLKFDLTMYVVDQPDGFVGNVEYAADLFDEETIERMLSVFQTIVSQAFAEMDRLVVDLDILSQNDARLLEQWNRTESEYPATSVAEAFDQQVRLTPNSVAIVVGETSLTYAELNDRANALAAQLAALGLVNDDKVGVHLGRSENAITSILAILKIGAAYVPLDPSYPQERRRLMLEDAQLAAIVYDDTAPLSGLASESIAEFNLSRLPPQASTLGALPYRSRPDSLAYIMYTSGSTGRPKGVCITHRAIIRLVKNTDYVRLGPDETILQFAPISFDASTFEIWAALLNGARLVIAPPGPLSSAELGRLVRDQQVTVLWLTAGLFHQVVDAGLEDFRSVRQLVAGGDVLSPNHVRKALQSLDDCTLINGYGPTENTTFSCCYVMSSADALNAGGSVPIGRPIANTRAYVLDEQRKPVPIGVVGELYVGGDGLARGYLNDEDLTARKFIHQSFGKGSSERLYKTGDLVRYRGDGNLEFVGRRDEQVKVRGFRIELGEVEACMRSYPAVSQAVVIARALPGSDKVLVGYFLPEAGEAVSIEDLRHYLQQKLPDHMVPGSLVTVVRFELSPNGKIDRSKLPSVSAPVRVLKSQRFLTPLENQILAIWEQVLDRRDIRVTDNFFEVGGTSLTAVRLFSQFKAVFGKELPLATLFQAPTIEQLAAVMQTGGWSLPWKSLVAIQPGGTKTPVFVVPGVGGNVLGFAHLANLLGSDQPFYGTQSRGLDGTERPLRRIEDMARAYIKEIREVQPKGPYLLAGYCMGGVIAFEMAQQIKEAGEEVSMLALVETWLPQSLRLGRFKALSFLHPVVFLAQGLIRHSKVLISKSPRECIASLKKVLGIVADMIRQKDIYRGDQQILYRDVVTAANYEAMASYIPREYEGRVCLFLASERPVDPARDTRMGWAKLAKGGYALYTVNAKTSGDFIKHPYVVDFSEKLAAELTMASSVGAPEEIEGRASTG